MIRRSTTIATIAILLSLLVHLTGLVFTSELQPERTAETTPTDVIALDNTFEDVAEAPTQPVEPEAAPVPEPPVAAEPEPEPEPELPDVPTSEALVASPNPQRTLSPDTGTAPVVTPDTAGPSRPEESGSPEPETVEPSGGDDGTTADANVTKPVEVGTLAEVPQGNPNAITEPDDVTATEPVVDSPLAPAPQQDEPQRIAALPVPVAPTLPVTSTLEPSAIPVVPPNSETLAPESPETIVEPAPELLEAEDAESETDEVGTTLVSSLRPPQRPATDSRGETDGSTGTSDIRRAPTKIIESPVTAYQRGRIDLIGRRNGGNQSGGSGFLESRGPGNSDVTNYVGRVLVHLNRVPPVHVSARGAARVFFEINPDGSLAWVDVIDSSGSKAIERAAKEQVRVAAPFPLPPNGVSRRMAFVYRIN